MKIRSAVFHSSAPDLAHCPPSEQPEFAFIGRSNVGKSSLINLLTGTHDLARVSDQAGKTRLINFFTINQSWSLVDLPGYGYAKVGKAARARFSAFVGEYLQHRPNLVGTFVLIDSRHSPQKIDLEFLTWMASKGLPLVLVFTKIDQLSPTAAKARQEAFLAEMSEISTDKPEFVCCSAKTGEGKAEILSLIESALTGQGATSPTSESPKPENGEPLP
jgi:GTP-binding protein